MHYLNITWNWQIKLHIISTDTIICHWGSTLLLVSDNQTIKAFSDCGSLYLINVTPSRQKKCGLKRFANLLPSIVDSEDTKNYHTHWVNAVVDRNGSDSIFSIWGQNPATRRGPLSCRLHYSNQEPFHWCTQDWWKLGATDLHFFLILTWPYCQSTQ